MQTKNEDEEVDDTTAPMKKHAKKGKIEQEMNMMDCSRIYLEDDDKDPDDLGADQGEEGKKKKKTKKTSASKKKDKSDPFLFN